MFPYMFSLALFFTKYCVMLGISGFLEFLVPSIPDPISDSAGLCNVRFISGSNFMIQFGMK